MYVFAANTQSVPQGAQLIGTLLPFIVMIGVFYLLIIKPQQKEQKLRNEMLNNLKKGMNVITAGGLIGEITELRDDTIQLKVCDKVILKMTRSSVSKVL